MATLNLEFVPVDPDTMELKEVPWGPTTIKVSIVARLQSMESRIKDVLADNLNHDDDMMSILDDQDSFLGYNIEVLQPICNHNYSLLEKDEHMFDFVSDFSLDLSPTQVDLVLNVKVHLFLCNRPYEDTRNAPITTSSSSANLTTARDRLIERRKLLEPDDEWDYRYVRLGTTWSSQSAPEADTSEDVILTGKLLLGYYSKGHKKASTLQLIEVQAWDFGDYWIGDCVNSYVRHDFSSHDNYVHFFRGVETLEDLHKRITMFWHLGARAPDPDVPMMPIYTLNAFDPASHGISVMQEPADVLVRYVSHMSDADQATDDGRTTDVESEMQNTQCRIGGRCTAGEIVQQIFRRLEEKAKDEAEENVNTAALFDELGDSWELQLWVLPQESFDKKLYRFPDRPNGSKDGLGEYMSERKVSKNDRRVFMEAHIVPQG